MLYSYSPGIYDIIVSGFAKTKQVSVFSRKKYDYPVESSAILAYEISQSHWAPADVNTVRGAGERTGPLYQNGQVLYISK